jgi:hypothetical protein
MSLNTRVGAGLCLLTVALVASPSLAQSSCVQWAHQPTANAPSGRYAHMMAYDSVRHKTVLFGGNIAGGIVGLPIYSNETWEYDGVNWTQRFPAHSPPIRGTGSMVFDSARGVCVLFGGQNANDGRLGDLWEYNGTDWVQRDQGANRPVARVSHYMAYDAARGVTVLFGGIGGLIGFPALQGDTWEWNGTSWSRRFPLIAPTPRATGGAAYDSSRHKVVIFAGGTITGATADTWEYDGLSWSLRFGNVEFWRITPAMTYDAGRGVSVAFGGILGNVRFADDFNWNGNSWWHGDLPGPIGRSDSVMVYDTDRQVSVLFGGESQQPARLNDTWELRNLGQAINITEHPQSQTVAPGTPVFFVIAAPGPVAYQWRRNGVNLPGQIGGALFVPSANQSNVGIYDCTVTNNCGTIVSEPARLQLIGGGNPCTTDFNDDGFVTPDDLSDFITEFFLAGPRSDFNGDGFRNPDDLADYIAAFFLPC